MWGKIGHKREVLKSRGNNVLYINIHKIIKISKYMKNKIRFYIYFNYVYNFLYSYMEYFFPDFLGKKSRISTSKHKVRMRARKFA